jgi:hypothetical protein
LQAAVKGKLADKVSIEAFYEVLFRTYDLEEARVLEAFARDGSVTVAAYVESLQDPWKQLECWELNPEHEHSLHRFTDKVRIGDSYQFAQQAIENEQTYDLIIIDIPQGLHSSSDKAVHLNRRPYNRDEKGSHGYDEYAEYNYQSWMQKRQDFYGCVTDREEILLSVYRQRAYEAGYVVKEFVVVPALPNVEDMEIYTSTVAMHLSRWS